VQSRELRQQLDGELTGGSSLKQVKTTKDIQGPGKNVTDQPNKLSVCTPCISELAR